MPIPGPIASQQIQLARRGTQAALSQARAAAALTAEELRDLAAEISETLGVLVPQSLSGDGGDAILTAADETNRAIQEILLRREQHLARLDRVLAEFDRERAAGEVELERITAILDQHWGRQQEVSEGLTQRLAEDERFQAWADEAAETEAALERAEAGLAEMEYDATQKLPAYEKSRLFKYLYDRRLGTSRYVAGATDRRMDQWIAGLINFPRAKAGYDFLKNTPEQVRAAMAAGRDQLARLMNQVERRRDDQAENFGLLQIVDETRAAERTRETVLTKLEQIRRKKDATRRELAEVENAGGVYYLPAFERIEALLEQIEQRVLKVEGTAVSAPRANQILARLRTFANQRQNIQLQAVAREQRIAWLNQHLSELGYFHQRFCSAGFDSVRSLFHDSLDLLRELERVRERDDSIDLVWQRMRRRQQFSPPLRSTTGADSPRGDSPLPQVLVSAMARGASPAMSGYARRAATRWIHSHQGGWKPVG